MVDFIQELLRGKNLGTYSPSFLAIGRFQIEYLSRQAASLALQECPSLLGAPDE